VVGGCQRLDGKKKKLSKIAKSNLRGVEKWGRGGGNLPREVNFKTWEGEVRNERKKTPDKKAGKKGRGGPDKELGGVIRETKPEDSPGGGISGEKKR